MNHMERFEVTGGARLVGEVEVHGAKNSILKLMAAALLAPGRHCLGNVPAIADVSIMAELLVRLGCQVSHEGNMKDFKVGINTWDESSREAGEFLEQFDAGIFPEQPIERVYFNDIKTPPDTAVPRWYNEGGWRACVQVLP